MEHTDRSGRLAGAPGRARQYELIVIAVALSIFAGALFGPSLMDDVDAVQAQIARNMLESGDWVSARLNGVLYLEKSPLKYWMMAISYAIFGVHDWAARLPVVLSCVALCWLTARIGRWAFDDRTGFYAGLVLAASVGLWLFTRILIPDVILTLTIALALWSLLRALDDQELRPRLWAALMAASIAAGLLLKGLIAAVFPCAAAALWLLLTGQLFVRRTWQRLRPLSGALIVLALAAPWHILAILRNPPYFDFTLSSEPFVWRGFFWFYFLNEHVFRFLNIRHPRDYNTVPRLLFWGFHMLWFFPWSAWMPGTLKLQYRGMDRAARTRLLAVCWLGCILVFFTFSTTQEYYSLPAYPAFALLLGGALALPSRWPARALAGVCALALATVLFLLSRVWNLPAPGDISRSLTQNPDLYTLSLGHMGDLTLASFAYLKLPLALAAAAFLTGVVFHRRAAVAGFTLMMILFLNAARLAMITFDPYLSSKPLADALAGSPPGQVIVDNQYYAFSSVFFYANIRGMLLNGRVNNLEYGSYAPGAPEVFLNDAGFAERWRSASRHYLLAEGPRVERLRQLAAPAALHLVRESGGKFLYTNQAP